MGIVIARDKLINRVATINVDNLPPVKHLIMYGKPIEKLSREQLIGALYTIVREMERMKLEVS